MGRFDDLLFLLTVVLFVSGSFGVFCIKKVVVVVVVVVDALVFFVVF